MENEIKVRNEDGVINQCKPIDEEENDRSVSLTQYYPIRKVSVTWSISVLQVFLIWRDSIRLNSCILYDGLYAGLTRHAVSFIIVGQK